MFIYIRNKLKNFTYRYPFTSIDNASFCHKKTLRKNTSYSNPTYKPRLLSTESK